MLLVQLRTAGSTDHPSGRAVSITGFPCRAGRFGGFQARFLPVLRSYPFISLHRKENLFRDQGGEG